MLRGSELLQLRVGDILEESDKSGWLELTFTTKANEKGDAVQYLGASTMRIVNEYIKMAGLTEDDKLVIGNSRWDRPSSKNISMRALNGIGRRLGQDHFGEHLSFHSFRVGSAQTLFSQGASLPELQTIGRWNSSKMSAHYCRKQFADRNAMAKHIYGKPCRGIIFNETRQEPRSVRLHVNSIEEPIKPAVPRLIAQLCINNEGDLGIVLNRIPIIVYPYHLLNLHTGNEGLRRSFLVGLGLRLDVVPALAETCRRHCAL